VQLYIQSEGSPMASVTTTVNINSSTYTALSSASSYVEVFVRRGQSVRFDVGQSAPSAGTDAYELIHGPSAAGDDIGRRYAWNGLASDEEVYARLDNVDYRTTDFDSTTSDLVVITSNTMGGSSGSVTLAVGSTSVFTDDAAYTPATSTVTV